jgi:hypothetical protein
VHVDEAFEPILDGVQLTEVNVVLTGICRVIMAAGSELASVAETIAIGAVDAVSVPEMAENVVLFCPEWIVTVPGTLTAALLLAMETAV